MPKKLTPAQKEEQRKIRLAYAKRYYMENRDRLIKYAREKCKYANKRIYLEDDDPTKGKQFKKISKKDPDFSRSETQKAIVELPPKLPRKAPLPPKPLPPKPKKPKKKIILKPPPSPSSEKNLKTLLQPQNIKKVQELLQKIGIIRIYDVKSKEDEKKRFYSKCKMTFDDLTKKFFNPKYDKIFFNHITLQFENYDDDKMKLIRLNNKYVYDTNDYKNWLNINAVYEYVNNKKLQDEIQECIYYINDKYLIANYLEKINDEDKKDFDKLLNTTFGDFFTSSDYDDFTYYVSSEDTMYKANDYYRILKREAIPKLKKALDKLEEEDEEPKKKEEPKPKKEEPKPKKEEPKPKKEEPKKEELTTNEKLKKLLSPDHPKFNKTQELLEKIGIINIYEHYLLENDQINLPFKFVKNKSSKCKISSDELIEMYFNPKYEIVFDRMLLTFKNTASGIHTKMKMYKLSKKYIYHTNQYKDWLNIDNVYDYVYNDKMNKEIDNCIEKIKKYMIISNYLHIIKDKEKNDYSKKLSILRDGARDVGYMYDTGYISFVEYYLLKKISDVYGEETDVNKILKNINDFYRTIPIKVMDYINNKLPKKEEPKPKKEEPKPKKEEPKPKKKEEPKPKKEEPKPKKKEEPKPKKEEPKEEQKEEPKNKEEVFENIKQFLDIQNELSSDKAHKYLNNDMSVKVYLLDILRRNNNDCYTHDQYGNILNEMLLSGQYSKIVNVPKKGVEIIVDDYIRCKKKGKMILIPVGLKPSQSTGHANMLILNYHRNEIELFEPHGKRVSKPRRLYETLQTFTDNFNKVLKKKYKDEKEMKFVNPDEVCPSSKQYKIFQSYEQGAIDTSKYSKKYDMRIREPGGYCLAWSMFYADLRLKFPTISNEDLIKKTSEILTNDPEKLRRFIRGQTKQLYEFYKTIQKEAGFTQEDMIRFYKLGKKGMTLKEWKEYMDMENKIDKYLDGKYKEYAKPIKL